MTETVFSDLLLGTDVVELARLKMSFERNSVAFFRKLLTDTEISYCDQKVQERFIKRAAGRIAVKEAVAKALGTGMRGLSWAEGLHWHEIEVVSAENTPPKLNLSGETQKLAEAKGVKAWRLSLSHDGPVATATVIALI